MKIGIFSQWYDPEPGPASLPGVYARAFRAQGHDVKVLTGFPNYPDGKVYDGYKIRRRSREVRDDIEVNRVALYAEHSASALGRIANYASFALSATASGREGLRDVDAVWVYNSPATVTMPLLAHTRWGRTPYFLHVQDLWPDSLVSSGMIREGAQSKIASALISPVVRLAEKKSAVIGVISRSVRDLILERHAGLDPNKIVYAPNPTNELLFRPVDDIRRELGVDMREASLFEVMYAGAVGEVQGLDTLLDVARRLADRPEIRITIVGDGISRERLERRVRDEGIANVRFLGRVSQDQIPALMAQAHLQVVSLASEPFLEYTTPSKISALLSSGVPIVGQIAGDGARLLTESGAARVATPGDVDGLHEAIVSIADGGEGLWSTLGASGREYYNSNLAAAATSKTILASLAESANIRLDSEGMK